MPLVRRILPGVAAHTMRAKPFVVKPILLWLLILCIIPFHSISQTTVDDQVALALENSRGRALVELDSLWEVYQTTSDANTWEAASAIAAAYQSLLAHDKSIEVYEALYANALAQNDSLKLPTYAQHLGQGYRNLGLYNEALDRFMIGLTIAEQTGETEAVWRILIDLGIVKQMQKSFVEALEYYSQALEYARPAGDQAEIARVINNMGSVHTELEDYGMAKEYLQEAIEINKELGSTRHLAYNYNNLALVYKATGNIENAKIYQEKSIEYKMQLNDHRGLAASYANLANIHFQLEENERALTLLQKSEELAKTYTLSGVMPDIYEYYITHFEAQGDFERAFQYQKKLIALTDSIERADNRASLSEMAANYQRKQVEVENTSLKKDLQSEQGELRRRETILFSTFTIIGILLILISAYFFSNKRKAETNVELQQKLDKIKEQSDRIKYETQRVEYNKEQLERLKVENELYLSTLNHDIRGLATAIRSLLGIIGEKNTDRELRDKISLVGFSADNLSWLVENMIGYSHNELIEAEDPAPFDLRQLLERLNGKFRGLFQEKEIDFIVNIELESIERLGNKHLIEQMMYGLLDSAFKLTKEGYVRLDIQEMSEDTVQIKTSCSSTNLEPGFLKRVFNKFYLTSPDIYEALGGSGLNLYMVSRIAESQRAKFESIQEPEQLTFLLTLALPVSLPVEA